LENNVVINSKITIPGSEISISTSRSSGPGGQHVNKTSSRVSLRWNILNSVALTEIDRKRILRNLRSRLVGLGEILIHVESERSQLSNRELARERLVGLLRKALVSKKRRIATKPSLGSKNARIKKKKKRGIVKTLRRQQRNDESN